MQVFDTKSGLRAFLKDERRKGKLGLVPTMGYLHAGHMALVDSARQNADTVVASIFVNPRQFGDAADLQAYPRDTARDLEMFEAHGVDAVFVPEIAEMYSDEAQTVVETTELSKVLMGKVRPGHFAGVTTVVAKLFNIVQPDFAYFGEKDFQQLLVIRRMVEDLDFPITITGVPTVRDADGLALSSRNVRLSKQDRQGATVLSRALFSAEAAVRAGVTSAEDLRAHITDIIHAEPRAEVKSIDLCDAQTLEAAQGNIKGHPVVALLAVAFGDILLIDQHVLNPA